MKTTEFKVHCIEIVVNCIYYNPQLTISILEENQWTQGFFTTWFNTLDKFSRLVMSLIYTSVENSTQAAHEALFRTNLFCTLTIESMIRNLSSSLCVLYLNSLLKLFLPPFKPDGRKCLTECSWYSRPFLKPWKVSIDKCLCYITYEHVFLMSIRRPPGYGEVLWRWY
jgi:hypothetical protein